MSLFQIQATHEERARKIWELPKTRPGVLAFVGAWLQLLGTAWPGHGRGSEGTVFTMNWGSARAQMQGCILQFFRLFSQGSDKECQGIQE